MGVGGRVEGGERREEESRKTISNRTWKIRNAGSGKADR